MNRRQRGVAPAATAKKNARQKNASAASILLSGGEAWENIWPFNHQLLGCSPNTFDDPCVARPCASPGHSLKAHNRFDTMRNYGARYKALDRFQLSETGQKE
jgi:hypothetical protein